MKKHKKPSVRKAFFYAPQPDPKIIPQLKVCTSCRTVGFPKEKVNGNILAEIAVFAAGILALFFSWYLTAAIFMALAIYFVWKVITKSMVCQTCEDPFIISYTSPLARTYLAQNSNSIQ